MKDQHYAAWYTETQKSWVDVMEQTCRIFPEREYIVFGEKRITYREFYRQVEELSKGLRALGIGKNDVVAIWMPNCPEWMVIQFAIYKAGAVLLPIYTYYRTMEVEYALKQSGAKALFMKDNFIGKIDALRILREIVPEVDWADKSKLASNKLPELKAIISLGGERAPGRFSYDEIVEWGNKVRAEIELVNVDPFDVMNIMYTSGTTGFPKGGISIHRTNLATVYHWTSLVGVTEDTVVLGQVPLFTNFGGLYVGPLAMLRGAKVVLTEFFDAANSLRLIEQEKVTYVPCSPSMFIMIMEHPDFSSYDLRSLSTGHVAGAPLSANVMDDIVNKMGIQNIMQAYGLSECGGVATVTTKDDPYEKRLHTVGRPLPSAKVKVVDPETLEPVAGAPGEIWLHDVYPGSCVGGGYWRMPEKTKEVITEDGWFRTGDLGMFDEDGYLHFVGRLKEMFTVGGFNIYPAEIENFIQTHPNIQEAYVIGVPDHRLGEVPMAWVRLKAGERLTEDAVIDYVKQHLSSQKVPRHVRFFKEGELPMTGSGKVQKYKLLEMWKEE